MNLLSKDGTGCTLEERMNAFRMHNHFGCTFRLIAWVMHICQYSGQSLILNLNRCQMYGLLKKKYVSGMHIACWMHILVNYLWDAHLPVQWPKYDSKFNNISNGWGVCEKIVFLGCTLLVGITFSRLSAPFSSLCSRSRGKFCCKTNCKTNCKMNCH
jgi:hypothetical protein